MPVDYPYRKNTESLINDRISILKKSNTIEEAEKKIGMGQIEEVVISTVILKAFKFNKSRF